MKQFGTYSLTKPVIFSGLFSIIFSVFCFSSCFSPAGSPVNFTKVHTIAGFNREFGEPFGIAFHNGEFYVSDGENGHIRRIGKDGQSTVLTDKLDTPSQIAFDKNGDLLVADSGTHTIKKISPHGEVSTVAGVENQKGFQDGEAGQALFNAPVGLAVFEDKIFVADTYNDKIRVIENGRVSTLAGSEKGFADGFGEQAMFDTPCSLAVWQDGRILAADTGNRRIRVIEKDGQVRTLTGNGNQNLTDGTLLTAELVEPTAVTVDDFGIIYFTDGNAIRAIGRRFFPFVETLTGDRRGFADGHLHSSRFNRPNGLAFDEKGNLYVADGENQVIRTLTDSAIGREITESEKNNLRLTAAEFRRLGEPRWTYDPPQNRREIAGTLGEIRGEIADQDEPVWFHNGLDIVGGYGETARFIRDEKVLRPMAVAEFQTRRELLRMPTLGYIHIRLGRDKDEKIFNDDRFEFFFDETRKLRDLRISRGTKFKAGEAIGTLNAMNHVHLVAGRSGAEMNALDALILPDISDRKPPTIEKVLLYDENWREFETQTPDDRIKLTGKTRIVVRAFDQMDGNADRRRLGVYKVGYQILYDDKTPVSGMNWTISFEKMPENEAVRYVYAKGSISGYAPVTVFNYIASNRVNGDFFKEDFLDAGKLESGKYIIRVTAADFFNNQTTKDINIEVNK